MRPIYWFKEANGFDYEYSSNIYLRLKIFFSFFIPMFRTKANMNIYFLYQPCSHMYVQ